MSREGLERLRKFGLEQVGAVPWGTHLCQLYQTKRDSFNIVVPYIATGLHDNEYCLWITSSSHEAQEAKKTLRKAIPELDSFFEKGQLEVVSFKNYFFDKEEFNVEKIIQNLSEKEQKILNDGFDGLRFVGDVSWVKRKFWTNFLGFERTLNMLVRSLRTIALCNYPLDKFKNTDILDIEQNHMGTLVKRATGWTLIENAVQRMENEEEYRNIIKTSIDGFFIVDPLGKFLDANASYCDLIGYNRAELLNMGVKDIEVNETEKEIEAHIQKITRQGHDRFETAQRHKNGNYVDIEISANYMGEAAYGRIFVFAHNIGRRKQNEEALRQRESQYRELADSIADSFVALNSDLKYVYWNKAAEKVTGIRAEDAIGRHLFEVFKEDEGTRKVAKTYLKVLKNQKPRIFIDQLVMNGRKVVVENHIYPSKTGISVFTKDITQRKELQDKLEEYTERLEELVKIRTEKLKAAERLATIGETAGMVGHDIRNPLQAICGELYLAKNEVDSLQEGETKDNLKESLNAISEQITYINKIVADLQDYAKILVPCLETVDLAKVMNGILSSVTVPPDIQVGVSIQKGFPKFQSDLSYLRRVLINLITNAVQAMHSGGKLTITANYDTKKAFIRVKDTGPGIPEEARDKIFKPLFTTKAKGQGLGLAVVKKLTNALGGNISFESTIGKGTCFILEIPLGNETQ